MLTSQVIHYIVFCHVAEHMSYRLIWLYIIKTVARKHFCFISWRYTHKYILWYNFPKDHVLCHLEDGYDHSYKWPIRNPYILNVLSTIV